MFFTQEDYRKIYNWIKVHSIKDSEFNDSKPLDGMETITVVQQGHNVKFILQDFLEQLTLLNIPDFVNVTERYDLKYISLFEATKAIPYRSRKIGQVVTFLDEDGNWKIYQFRGEKKIQWNILTLWVDILGEIIDKGSIIPDEEDLTAVKEGDKTVVKFKDKAYNPDNFSGKGRVYLRKNITQVQDPTTHATKTVNLLTQSMISKENTIYIIQYDYNLNGQTITVPGGSTLLFKGGSISNGMINLNNCIIISPLLYIFRNIIVTNSIQDLNVEWFGLSPNSDDNSIYLTNVLNCSNVTFLFQDATYICKNSIKTTCNRVLLKGRSNDRRKTSIQYIGDESIFIDLDAYEIIVDGITFFGDTTYGNSTYIRLIDSLAEGNLDCVFKNCIFLNGNRGISATGRGLVVEGCLFVTINNAISINIDYDDGDVNQTGINNGRGFRIKNNRCHWCTGTFIYIYNNNNLDEYWINGLEIENNYSDGWCNKGIIDCYSRIRNSNISNNIFLGGGHIRFHHCIYNVNISNNITVWDIAKSSAPDMSKIYSWIYFETTNASRTVDGLIVTGNIVDYSYELVRLLNTQGLSAKNIVIKNNILKENTQRGFLSISNTYNIENIIVTDNIFEGTDFRRSINIYSHTNDIKNIVEDNNISTNTNSYNVEYKSTFINLDIDYSTFVSTQSNYKYGVIYYLQDEIVIKVLNGVRKLKSIISSINEYGSTTQRPSNVAVNFQYFDTTLNKPIWWNSTKWVDSEGNDADSTPITSGTFANKPTGVDVGYAYFCTDRQTTEGATNGIMIYYKGSNTWVDALGRVVS